MTDRRPFVAGALAVIAIGMSAIFAIGSEEKESSWHPARLSTERYPAGWRTSLPAAQAGAKFRLLLPSTEVLDPASGRDVYLFPGGTGVALEFPLLTPSTRPVRQEYLEVWEGRWTFSDDPSEVFAQDVEADPVSTALIRIEGVDVLTVNAHSPNDDEHANPSFVRFALRGLDIQVSGGDHMEDVLDIARSMIARYVPAD